MTTAKRHAMRPNLRLCVLIALCLAAAPSLAFTSTERRDGAEAHPIVVARHGGVYPNPRLGAYVTGIGARLALRTEQPAEAWTFTVLDDPRIGAFGHPGGYVYVTRGLLSFADNEGEVAAAIAQQMAHVILGTTRIVDGADGVPDRGLADGALLDGLVGRRIAGPATPLPVAAPEAGPTGAAPQVEPALEAVSARLALAMLTGAGWPKAVFGDLVNRLREKDALDATLRAGRWVETLGTDPTARALLAATLADLEEFERDALNADEGQEQHLQMLDGMTYGTSPDRPLFAAGRFVHPALRVMFDLPDGFRGAADTAQMEAIGPAGARMILDTTDEAGVRLGSYVRDTWAASLTRGVTAGFLYDLSEGEIGGFEMASAFLPYEDKTGAKVAHLLVIRTQDRDFRVRSIAPAENIDTSLAMEAATRTFRALPLDEAEAYREYALRIHQVSRGETLNLFGASMPYRDDPVGRFRMLNGYGAQDVPLVGDLVKLVVE